MPRLNVDLDGHSHTKLHRWCIEAGMTASDVIRHFIDLLEPLPEPGTRRGSTRTGAGLRYHVMQAIDRARVAVMTGGELSDFDIKCIREAVDRLESQNEARRASDPR